jgi:glutamyl-tRNA synthetase
VDQTTRPVRVRFAPSPTGDLHIGGVRTALFNWLFARRYGGKFVLRIEDTDQTRTKEHSLAGIIDGLRWAGLNWDEGPDIGGPFAPYIQSQRLAHYQGWADWLVENGKAYRAYESKDELELITKARENAKILPRYDRRGRDLTAENRARLEAEGRKAVVRLKVPLGAETVAEDMVRGPVRVENDTLEDIVLLKADGFPTYHLANIIDDHLMEISHVIRAEEWLPSLPYHVIIYQAFGWAPPLFAHVPVILKETGPGKMSKRDEGAKISDYMHGGYLPEAVVNFLCNVGWNYGRMDENGEEVQVFSKEQAAEAFDITRVTKSGTRFDRVKLAWLNGEYIRRMDGGELARRLRPYLEKAGLEVDIAVLTQLVPLIQERLKLLTDVVGIAGVFFREQVAPESAAEIVQKGMTPEKTREALQATHERLSALSADQFVAPNIEAAMREVLAALSLKPNDLFGAVRVCVLAQKVSPPLFESLQIVGQEKVLARIAHGIHMLEAVQTA